MQPTLVILISLGAAVLSAVLCGVLCGALVSRRLKQGGEQEARLRELVQELAVTKRELLSAQQNSIQTMLVTLTESQKAVFAGQDKHIADLKEAVHKLAEQQENAALALRRTLSEELERGRAENEKKLAEIRGVVDEKLQKTLETRLASSFKQVSERLEEVYKGLGEMQTIAAGVGDLKKVLTNVKARGNFGEYQLSAILSQILAPEQYEENVMTVEGSNKRVEFAVRLPGQEDGKCVYLPIDSKFPMEVYLQLTDAQETGNEAALLVAQKTFVARIKSFAAEISQKYISPPETTDFAIMFLPTESLYAEVIRMGLLEELQAKYHINIAGPTTMAALLNSLQMGFRTLAIQKRSSEAWEVLAAVRTEFEKFAGVLATAQNRLNQANHELDALVGTRTRAINRRLRSVSVLSDEESRRILLTEETGAEGQEEL